MRDSVRESERRGVEEAHARADRKKRGKKQIVISDSEPTRLDSTSNRPNSDTVGAGAGACNKTGMSDHIFDSEPSDSTQLEVELPGLGHRDTRCGRGRVYQEWNGAAQVHVFSFVCPEFGIVKAEETHLIVTILPLAWHASAIDIACQGCAVHARSSVPGNVVFVVGRRRSSCMPIVTHRFHLA